ncbi:CDGSH iron-sulfur domain-containing protein [Azospirillum sp.]|uniref:CDGSH iron-sulfur domain-containing protein n=1 Tax=Azospirillum sp. TaxID=34012 RepID=UPI002D31311D|nr:CDGSH iron-sulfur domain-containing protein [Azospirillum sp.]HYD67054.1 CDGSH iron-sulfur domain-containing protein [Azospirillum sp.]
MAEQVVAHKGPLVIPLKAGETYWWCRCGRSAAQPFCDGSHAGTGIEPMSFTPTKDMKGRFCGCKQTKKPPFCDGSHLDIK